MGAAKLTGYPPGVLEASPHAAPPSKPAFQPENPWSPTAALQEEAWLLVFSWVLFCRLLPDLLSPASASNGLSCASDLVSSWEASHARSVLCSSCRRQTPILCFGPRGHGLNTTKIFLSFMNVRSGVWPPLPRTEEAQGKEGSSCLRHVCYQAGAWGPGHPLGEGGLASR